MLFQRLTYKREREGENNVSRERPLRAPESHTGTAIGRCSQDQLEVNMEEGGLKCVWRGAGGRLEQGTADALAARALLSSRDLCSLR